MTAEEMTFDDIFSWLRENDPGRLQELYSEADRVRRDTVGEEVHLRGLIELSNYCTEQCAYCGIRSGNSELQRYRLDEQEIIESVMIAQRLGYGTVVMQAGEDPGIGAEWLAEIIGHIKEKTELAITLSMGERSLQDLQLWRDAGADRYLLRFETSDLALFNHIHCTEYDEHPRLKMLRQIQAMGYETGSGVLVGIPGQTWSILARDIELFRELDLDMIGIGPYVPHPQTPLADELARQQPTGELVPNDEATVYKVLSLTRLVRPDANIPSTSALATINAEAGRQNGLTRGANIIMPNVTPAEYRKLYEIYPSKASSRQTIEETHQSITDALRQLGRPPGKGRGSRQSF